MLYHWYELGHSALRPARALAEGMRALTASPLNPMADSFLARHTAATLEVFERTTRRYAKPAFGLAATEVDGVSIAVREKVLWQKPFCKLTHFERDISTERRMRDPRILLVAPMSGHFATLLRGTVETFLPNHEVYISEWEDAGAVPHSAGDFGLDDYVDYVREMLAIFAGDVHVFAVCQPAVPVLAAISLMEADNDPNVPATLMMAGGPIDTRISPTAVNAMAEQRGTAWFRNNVISAVPWPNAGAGRHVYPGFLQLTGFVSMNLERHTEAHRELFMHLVRGDGSSAEKHREFYDEYLAVMDLTETFYLDTIDAVFVNHRLAKGEMTHRGCKVDPGAIRRVPTMTIEGGKDDITGAGQCHAALDLCANLAPSHKYQYTADGVGHYGIFNGSRFRSDIAPRMMQFMRTHDVRTEYVPERIKANQRNALSEVMAHGHLKALAV